MRNKYPPALETEKVRGEALLKRKVRHLEEQLEAAYWSSGKWTTLGYDKWLETLHEESPVDQA